MVCRLVKNQKVRIFKQCCRESHSFALSAGESVDNCTGVEYPELGKHLGKALLVVPCAGCVHGVHGFCEAFLIASRHCRVVLPDCFSYGTRGAYAGVKNSCSRLELRQLFKVAYPQFGAGGDSAAVWGVLAAKHSQQGCLAGAVARHKSYFLSFRNSESEVAEQKSVAETFSEVFDLYDGSCHAVGIICRRVYSDCRF